MRIWSIQLANDLNYQISLSELELSIVVCDSLGFLSLPQIDIS